MFRFLFVYIIPVSTFVYCYGRIFHTIRRQSKVVGSHVGRTDDVPMATTSRAQNTGQVQQQETGTATGTKLSRTEMNVIKTMIAVIACYLIFWSFGTIANNLLSFGVSIFSGIQCNINTIRVSLPTPQEVGDFSLC